MEKKVQVCNRLSIKDADDDETPNVAPILP